MSREIQCALDQVPADWRVEVFAAREIPGQGLCVLRRFAFTTGLMTQVIFDGGCVDYRLRFCYPDIGDAFAALATWDGQGDPPGDWIKEKETGRLGPGAKRQA